MLKHENTWLLDSQKSSYNFPWPLEKNFDLRKGQMTKNGA